MQYIKFSWLPLHKVNLTPNEHTLIRDVQIIRQLTGPSFKKKICQGLSLKPPPVCNKQDKKEYRLCMETMETLYYARSVDLNKTPNHFGPNVEERLTHLFMFLKLMDINDNMETDHALTITDTYWKFHTPKLSSHDLVQCLELSKIRFCGANHEQLRNCYFYFGDNCNLTHCIELMAKYMVYRFSGRFCCSADKTQESKQRISSLSCRICYINTVQGLYQPCGHCVCTDCYDRIFYVDAADHNKVYYICPFCKTKADDIFSIMDEQQTSVLNVITFHQNLREMDSICKTTIDAVPYIKMGFTLPDKVSDSVHSTVQRIMEKPSVADDAISNLIVELELQCEMETSQIYHRLSYVIATDLLEKKIQGGLAVWMRFMNFSRFDEFHIRHLVTASYTLYTTNPAVTMNPTLRQHVINCELPGEDQSTRRIICDAVDERKQNLLFYLLKHMYVRFRNRTQSDKPDDLPYCLVCEPEKRKVRLVGLRCGHLFCTICCEENTKKQVCLICLNKENTFVKVYW